MQLVSKLLLKAMDMPVTLSVQKRYPKFIYVKKKINGPYASTQANDVICCLLMHKGFISLSYSFLVTLQAP